MTVVDFAAAYALAPDLAVFRRDDTTIQIGTESPRSILITDAPPHATDVLSHLGDCERLSDAIAQLGGDARQWRHVFGQLAVAGFLSRRGARRGSPAGLTGERLTLIHRFGHEVADRIIATRADATVTIEGTGYVADMLGGLMDAAGVGMIHQWAGPGCDSDSGDPRQHLDSAGAVTHHVRYRPPAAQTRPTITILVGPQRPAPWRVAELLTSVVPHLPVHVTSARLVVGPLVLPGRSTCINCINRHRFDADTQWPAVAAATALPARPSALLAHQAASLAAAEALRFIDRTDRPASVGATIEQLAGSLSPQRRQWPRHSECECRNVATRPIASARSAASHPASSQGRTIAAPAVAAGI